MGSGEEETTAEALVGALAGVDGEDGEDNEEANENNQNDGHSFADGLFERIHIWGCSRLSGSERDLGEEKEMDEDMIEEGKGWRGHGEKGRRRRTEERRKKKQRDGSGFEFKKL